MKVIREKSFSLQDNSGYGTVRVYDNGTVEVKLTVRFSSLREAKRQAPNGVDGLAIRLLSEIEG